MIRKARLIAAVPGVMAAAACATMGSSMSSSSSATADSTVIHDDIAYLASDRLEGRLTGTAGNDSAAAFLARRYTMLRLRQGSPGYLQKFVARSAADAHAGITNGRPTQNVVAILPGSDPRFAGQYIVVGAHFDHLGRDSQFAMDPRRKMPSGTVPTTTLPERPPFFSSLAFCQRVTRGGRSSLPTSAAKRRGCLGRSGSSIIRLFRSTA